tara:strand:+ start:186 stop:653 length:468 start_codon:yes stop_codon:yes gene_type:complete
MPLEIEKKFLVLNDSFKNKSYKSINIIQGYIFSSDSKVLRVWITPKKSKISIKSGSNIIRNEFEYEIPSKDAQDLLLLSKGYVIYKTRYLIKFEGFIWEVDVFQKENKGLIVAEIELEQENQKFIKPRWLGEEISFNKKYYNCNLAEIPYSLWDL